MRSPPAFAVPFKETMRSVFQTNVNAVLLQTEMHEVEWDGRTETLAVYGMTMKYNFTRLAGDLRAARVTASAS